MIKAAIIGASGYSGAELVKILTAHPQAEITAITSTSHQGDPIDGLYPHLIGVSDLVFTEFSPDLSAVNDVVFLALPHGRAMELAPALKAAGGAKIIDLSGDFRLPAPVYEDWYQKSHASAALIEEAVYGLSELNGAEIAKSNLIANPGCFATGVILAVAPLLDAGLAAGTIGATCITGVSGAGRGLSETIHFCRADENLAAYKVGGLHQHIPEMLKVFNELAEGAANLLFTPILGPLSRGIYTTASVVPALALSLDDLFDLYHSFYAGKFFIKVLPPGRYPEVKAVAGTNYCHIGLAVDRQSGAIVVISALDNLGKGAAGQAVQNMNLMLGLEESAGLTREGLYP